MKKLYKSFRLKSTVETMVPRCNCDYNCTYNCATHSKPTYDFPNPTSSFTTSPTGA